jgi:hypothetical protein
MLPLMIPDLSQTRAYDGAAINLGKYFKAAYNAAYVNALDERETASQDN